ncbi:MAG: ABC transporter ATP-binding protein [Rhodococcus sp. (in: high G+C Gram-positive bacteria)]
MLELRSITKRFGFFTVFDSVDVTVRPGSACAVVGSNGSGKSTLLRCAVGAEEVDDGRVLLDGRDLDETSPGVRAALAAVVDDPAGFPHLSVREHLVLLATAHGVIDVEQAVTRVVTRVGLAAAADQLPVTLSSGQRHRLALASVFVRPRRLIVLDEPEQHLDSAGRRWLSSTLIQEKAAGTAVLLASHDPAIVEVVADVVIDSDSWR